MRFFITVITILFVLSCTNSSKLLYKKQVNDEEIQFFQTKLKEVKHHLSSFYAKVDSSGVRVYYTFYANDINKIYADDNNLLYILNSTKQPMLSLTMIDSLVLAKADNLMDSLHYNLKRAIGATGFDEEVFKTPLK